MLGQQTSVVNQRVVGEGLPVSHALRTEPEQAQQMPRKQLALAALAGHVNAILPPCAVEERNDPVIKNVDKIAQGVVAVALSLDDQRSIRIWKNSLGADQTHEINEHSCWTVFGPLQVLDLTGWERQGRMRAKMCDLGLRMDKLSNRLPLRTKLLEQANCLEEIEGIRLPTKLFFDFAAHQIPGIRQIRIDCPALGVHSSSASLR